MHLFKISVFQNCKLILLYLILNSILITIVSSHESKIDHFYTNKVQSAQNSSEEATKNENLIPEIKNKKSGKKRNQITINQCTEGVLKISNAFFQDEKEDPEDLHWAVPDWLKGPKSENRSEKLNQAEFFNGALFKFNVQTKRLNCRSEKAGREIGSISNFKNYTVKKSDVYRNNSYDIDWQYGGYSDYFTPFGEFKMQDYFLDAESFCVGNYSSVNSRDGGFIQLEVCIPKTKIRKCCPYGTVVKFGLNDEEELPTCVEILGEDWAPFYYRSGAGGLLGVDSEVEDVSYFSELFNPECGVYDKLTPNRRAAGPYLADIKVLADGTVLTRSSGNHKWNKPAVYGEHYIKEFCIDGYLNSDQLENKNAEGPVDFLRIPENQIILFCHQQRDEIPENTVYSWLYFFLFTFSAMILAAIVVVYLIILKRQNIHGWTTLGFTGSMCLWFIFSAVTHGAGLFQGSGWSIEVGGAACVLNGILWHFFYIATFSWMVVLNYDLWSSTCTPSIPTTAQKANIRRKFGMYCCAGFGPPILVVMIALIVEHQFDIFDDHVVRPMYGHDICCLDKTALFYYAFSVSSVFFLLNLFFAGSTIVFLCKYRKKTKQCLALQKELSHFGKLFILMGFTWIFEMASWKEELTWYWAVFDVYNIIQAFGLFWIFVGRREVLEQLFEQSRLFRVCCKCLKQEDEKKLSETEKASQGYSQTYKGISMVTVGNVLSTCVDIDVTNDPSPVSIRAAENLNSNAATIQVLETLPEKDAETSPSKLKRSSHSKKEKEANASEKASRASIKNSEMCDVENHI